jgi:hypothetical protein
LYEKTPQGSIGMILHKGGDYDHKSDSIVGGRILTARYIDNLIVDKASFLMACRLAPGAVTGSSTAAFQGNFLTGGLQYLAVGVGILNDPSKPYDAVTNPVNTNQWNLQNPPAENLSDVKLKGEIFRKGFTSWSFVNVDGSDSSNPTNVLKLVTTFVESEAAGPLTEMGLFGGNAQPWSSGTGKDTGYMFNYKTFPVWNKPLDARLTITWKLTF